MDERAEDAILKEALEKQRELLDWYKSAAKRAPDKYCKELFEHLQNVAKDQARDLSNELARHRMERKLGHVLDHKH